VRARFALLALAAWGAAGCSAGPLEVAALMPDSLTNGLVAHWALDENFGTFADDSSGNGRTGAIAGPGWSWVPGQFGSALHFSGSDYVSVGAFPRATPSYSVSAWVLIEASEMGAPIVNLISTETLGGGWALYTLGPPAVTYDFRYLQNAATATYEMASCACVVAGSWTHLAAVLDGDAASLTLYVNGMPSATIATTTAILPGNSTLYMARTATLNPTFSLTGALDDIAVWDRALVPAEVALVAKAAVPDPM
jgi:hypothetical protein